jgi:hypothetical protein
VSSKLDRGLRRGKRRELNVLRGVGAAARGLFFFAFFEWTPKLAQESLSWGSSGGGTALSTIGPRGRGCSFGLTIILGVE